MDKNTTIEVALDTNQINDNLREGVQVSLNKEEPVESYTAPDGTIITGTGLVKTSSKVTTLGEVQKEIAMLTASIAKDTARLTELQTLLPDLETVIDGKITEAIANGAIDQRTK